VLAKVGGAEIRQGEVDVRIGLIVASQMGSPLPPDQIPQFRAMLGGRVLEALIEERMIDAAIAANDIEISDEQYLADFEDEIDLYLSLEDQSRAEFESRVEMAEGKPFAEYLAERAADPGFRRAMRQLALFRKLFPAELAVGADEIAARYEAEMDTEWSRPETVRASHILFKPSAESPEADAAALAEAERVLALARAEGADFAALAREHSQDPTVQQGSGDLGFFPREGKMVEPFAAAAYELELGQISAPVKTDFGYHVILLTDRRPAHVVSLADATPAVERFLFNERLNDVRTKYVETLRAAAQIERM
jgi:peptidyl-prolyl cis-trans isomerase C